MGHGFYVDTYNYTYILYDMKVEVKLYRGTNGTTERRLGKKRKEMAVWEE